MSKLKTIVTLTASALATLGCTSLEKNEPRQISIRPLTEVRHGSDANAIYQTGRYFQGQLRYEQAIAAYKDALARNPNHADAHNGLGVVYSIQGRSELAEQAFKAAINAAPDAAYLHNNLGYHYLKQGRPDAARVAFERARNLDPGNSRIASNLAAVQTTPGVAVDTNIAAQRQTAPPLAVQTPAAPGAVQANANAQLHTVVRPAVESSAYTVVATTIAAITGTATRQSEASHTAAGTSIPAPDGRPSYTVVERTTPGANIVVISPQPVAAESWASPPKPTLQFEAVAQGVWELRAEGPSPSTQQTGFAHPAGSSPLDARTVEILKHAAIADFNSKALAISSNNITAAMRIPTAAPFTSISLDGIRPAGARPYLAMPVSININNTSAGGRFVFPANLTFSRGQQPLIRTAPLASPAISIPVVAQQDQAYSGRAYGMRAIDVHRYRVEISNGNGITGLAGRLAGVLRSSGIENPRLTNHLPFGRAVSEIQYTAGAEGAAQEIRGAISSQLPTVEVRSLGGNMQIKVLLGKDFPGNTQVTLAKSDTSDKIAVLASR